MSVVNVTLITNAGKKKDQVSDSTTVRQIYEKFSVNYDACTNTIDSVPLQIGQLDKSLRELGCGENVRMSSIVKMDNAAEVIIAGTAAIVKSKYQLEDWLTAVKFDPDLGLYDDNDDPIFKVFVEEGPGSLNENGVVWSAVAGEGGFAVATLILDPTVEDKRELVKDKQGLALLRLKEVEANLEEVIEQAKKNAKEIDEMVKSI